MKEIVQPTRFHCACMIVARLCCIVSLWQAPIPWLHCHGTSTDAAVPPGAAQELSQHLAVFHSTFESPADHDLGWHFHWVLPTWSHALDDTPDDEPPAEEAIAFDPADVSSTLSADSLPPTAVVAVIATMDLTRTQAQGFQYSVQRRSPFAPPLPLIVLRC